MTRDVRDRRVDDQPKTSGDDMTKTLQRPLAALLTAVAVVALVAAGTGTAQSAPPLPEVRADELLAGMLRTAQEPPPMAGELSATVGPGLPELPGDAEDSTLADLLGRSRLRVERSPEGLRIALLGERSERLVVTDGTTVTTWDSRTLTAVRTALPQHEESRAPEGPAFEDPLALAIPLRMRR